MTSASLHLSVMVNICLRAVLPHTVRRQFGRRPIGDAKPYQPPIQQLLWLITTEQRILRG